MATPGNNIVKNWAAELADLENQINDLQEAKRDFYKAIRDEHGRIIADALKNAMRLSRLDDAKRATLADVDGETDRLLSIIEGGADEPHARVRAPAPHVRAREDAPEEINPDANKSGRLSAKSAPKEINPPAPETNAADADDAEPDPEVEASSAAIHETQPVGGPADVDASGAGTNLPASRPLLQAAPFKTDAQRALEIANARLEAKAIAEGKQDGPHQVPRPEGCQHTEACHSPSWRSRCHQCEVAWRAAHPDARAA